MHMCPVAANFFFLTTKMVECNVDRAAQLYVAYNTPQGVHKRMTYMLMLIFNRHKTDATQHDWGKSRNTISSRLLFLLTFDVLFLSQ